MSNLEGWSSEVGESELIEKAKREKGFNSLQHPKMKFFFLFVSKLFKELVALKASGEKLQPEMFLFSAHILPKSYQIKIQNQMFRNPEA